MWSLCTSLKFSSLVGVFLAWTVTSFLCHECGKLFLLNTETKRHYDIGVRVFYLHNYPVVVLTAVQCLTCVAAFRVSNLTDRNHVTLLIVTHVLSTLATNYSMAYLEVSSVFAIKLLEPITMAIAHYFFIERVMNIETVLSIPVIIAGTFIFTGNSNIASSQSLGVVPAVLSNILFAARNITLKKTQDKDALNVNKPIYVKVLLIIEAGILAFTAWLHMDGSLLLPTTVNLFLLFASGFFHVIYSYISTCVLLKVMNVVSHSIANIFKRLIVVLLLYSWGQRKATWFNFFGLLLASFGLAIYVFGKVRKHEPSSTTSNTKGFVLKNVLYGSLRRVTWLLIGFCIMGTLCTIIPSTEFQRLSLEMDNSSRQTKTFLSLRLVNHPLETNTRAVTLGKTVEVVNEAQRVLINLMTDIIGPANHVMLMEIATYENKGDPAITAGEVMLLRKMGKKIVYYCETYKCKNQGEKNLALNISRRYNISDLVILMQGGGNLVGYPFVDTVRESILNEFPNHKTILFSQSIWLFPGSNKSLENCQKIYSNRSNLYMFIRDKQSLQIAQNNFKGVKIILAPDMAFGLGHVPRSMPPYYDIVWLRRSDKESSKYILPEFPENISVVVSDWWEWKSNVGTRDMETSFIIAENGLNFLQRGRIVVTDRLHGHILSILMDIPHVLIDNPPYLKLSSFDKTWTSGLENTKLVSTGQEALSEALLMLQKYNATLPVVGPIDMNAFLNIPS